VDSLTKRRVTGDDLTAMVHRGRTRGWTDRDRIVEPLRRQLDPPAAGPAGR
jgi:hypothetical protein